MQFWLFTYMILLWAAQSLLIPGLIVVLFVLLFGQQSFIFFLAIASALLAFGYLLKEV